MHHHFYHHRKHTTTSKNDDEITTDNEINSYDRLLFFNTLSQCIKHQKISFSFSIINTNFISITAPILATREFIRK